MYNANEITKSLVSWTSYSCPLLSDEDAKMLWQSMSFMREASDRHSNLLDLSTSVPTMFYFLERLLVRSGVFLPMGAPQQNASLNQSEVFFVPSLLAQDDPTIKWTYMSNESWMTTLCHSWLFRDGAPPNIMEHVTVRILRDFYSYELSRTDTDGVVGIDHVKCNQSSMLVKFATIITDDAGARKARIVEVFVAVVDQSSSHSVASDVMGPYMQRVVVSGKGLAGSHGEKLWKGGYKLVLDSVRESLADMPNVESQVICPECLKKTNPQVALTLDWNTVLAEIKRGNQHASCLRFHPVNCNLICGTSPEQKTSLVVDPRANLSNIEVHFGCVVLVDVRTTKLTISRGSGFIVDENAGLVVTAGHVVFDMNVSSKCFGKPYYGYEDAGAVIMFPDTEGKLAAFRADIAAYDINNVDACVLRVRAGTINRSLKMANHFELSGCIHLQSPINLLGFNPGGKGVSPTLESVEGQILRHHSVPRTTNHQQQLAFVPSDELVARCRANSGHSGGPCVNAYGNVVGMLCRSDRVEPELSYLVPATEISPLIEKAKSRIQTKR
jgi:S1-C subfamily serine protease